MRPRRPRPAAPEALRIRLDRDLRSRRGLGRSCSVTDYEVPNKSDWVQYRAALRDVTRGSDPFAIEWPVKPSA